MNVMDFLQYYSVYKYFINRNILLINTHRAYFYLMTFLIKKEYFNKIRFLDEILIFIIIREGKLIIK